MADYSPAVEKHDSGYHYYYSRPEVAVVGGRFRYYFLRWPGTGGQAALVTMKGGKRGLTTTYTEYFSVGLLGDIGYWRSTEEDASHRSGLAAGAGLFARLSWKFLFIELSGGWQHALGTDVPFFRFGGGLYWQALPMNQ